MIDFKSITLEEAKYFSSWEKLEFPKYIIHLMKLNEELTPMDLVYLSETQLNEFFENKKISSKQISNLKQLQKILQLKLQFLESQKKNEKPISKKDIREDDNPLLQEINKKLKSCNEIDNRIVGLMDELEKIKLDDGGGCNILGIFAKK